MDLTKRYFLIGSVFISCIIPLITFPVYREFSVQALPIPYESLVSQPTGQITPHGDASTPISWLSIAGTVYVIGVILFGVRYLISLFRIIARIHKGKIIRHRGFNYVLLAGEGQPFTFLHFIFLNRAQFEHGLIPQEVLLHEEAHARQLHSLDLMLTELLAVVLWFNPIVYAMRTSVRLNHEFLADSHVLKSGAARRSYQESILNFAMNEPPLAFSNTFSYSFLKKRFTMMEKRQNRTSSGLKIMLMLPLVAVLLFSFSGRKIKTAAWQDKQGEPKSANVLSDPIAEYNRLAKYYNTYPKVDFVKKVKDMWIIRDLYESIPVEKRGTLEKYPVYTTSLSIYIANDGTYLIDDQEVKLEEITSLFSALSDQERSNIYLFDDPGDYHAFVAARGSNYKHTEIFPNDVYIHLSSQELIRNKSPEFERMFDKMEKSTKSKGIRRVSHALENEKITAFADEVREVLRKYDVKIEY
ncbi:MAG: M56 family metallopeptidase [Bacteroidota bacterium]